VAVEVAAFHLHSGEEVAFPCRMGGEVDSDSEASHDARGALPSVALDQGLVHAFASCYELEEVASCVEEGGAGAIPQ
jgi:hypothetical protein